MIPTASSFTSPPSHDRFMTRTRRIASSLRDLRSAAGNLPDAVVLLDNEQHVRWFNHAAEDLLGLRRPQDRGADLHERLRSSDLAGWLEEGAREPLNDIPAPGRPDRHLNVTLLPFGRRQRLLLARDISDLTRLEQVRRDFVANV
ncbi:MAG: PAS domain-containing protein, partial [Xanthomonadaceae bacterium]|nr:PAS domain-containing protein [Xanthomonadaceae bacterium]